jgi:hypothetical protein
MTEANSDIIQQASRRVWIATGAFVAAVAFVSLIPRNDRAIWDIPRITSAFAATPFADERYAVEPIALAYKVIGGAGPRYGGVGGPRDVNRARVTPLRQVGSTPPTTLAGVPDSALPTLPQDGNGLTGTNVADLIPGGTGGSPGGLIPGGFFPGFGGGPGTTAGVDPTNPTNPTNPTDPSGPTTPTTPGVPEPSMWLLMISGFGLVGAGLRRSRRRMAARA